MDKLDNGLIEKVAESMKLESALLKAVKLVESGNRDGFLPNGKPQILFEGHVMYKLLCRKIGIKSTNRLSRLHPNIIHKNWTRDNYIGGELEWNRLNSAIDIDKEIAFESTSWGMFQIMGFNYKLCGCSNVLEFVNLMCESHESQLTMMCRFMYNSGCLKYLKAHDWGSFAKKYNGPKYEENCYHIKLEKAYKTYKDNEEKNGK